MIFDKDYMKVLRTGKRILKANNEYYTHQKEKDVDTLCKVGASITVLMLLVALVFLLMTGCARAESIEGYDVNRWADAIKKVENSKSHPFGIMVRYKHTTPRQACINTIRHNHRNWVRNGHPGSFKHYLAEHYAPMGAGNDPMGLNRNWERNLTIIIERMK